MGRIQESTKTFSVPIEKEVTEMNKDGNESDVSISYKITFIGSARFMATSLSSLVVNPTKGIHKIICKDCDCFFENESLIKYECLSRNKDYSNKIKWFKKTFKFSNSDINKFIFLLRNGVYPYE